MPPDSSDIDNALVAYLAADALLKAELPDGVWLDQAGPGARQFGLVSVVDTQDVAVFDGTGFESVQYQITAVVMADAPGSSKAAAARIHDLLEDGTFPIPGYTLTACYREERVRGVEVGDDPDVRWFHRGGRYRVQASPSAAPVHK
jgi:hypothetical protein